MIRKRLLWLFVLQILLVLLISGVYLQYQLTATLETELDAKLESLAAMAASQVDAGLITLLSPGDETGRMYASLRSKLAAMANAGRIDRIVIFSPSGKVWLDSRNILPVGAAYFRFEFDRNELDRLLNNHNAHSPLFTGHDGVLYKSGYAALRSDAGIIGVVAVEGSAASLHIVKQMQSRLLQIGLLALTISLALSWNTSRLLTRPLLRLRKAAERLGKGGLTEPIHTTGNDEIAFLGATMEEMRRNLLQRSEEQKAMLAGVAHELRNPLGGIELFAGLLRDDADDEETRQRSQRILNESKNLQTLIQNFLDFARPIIAKPQYCRLSRQWPDILAWVQPHLGTKEIAISLHGDAGLWVDPQHLQQMFLNLIVNAGQAIVNAGKIKVSVTAQGERAFIDFIDTGRGVAADIRDKIFQPFFSSKEKGLGLGLAMVRSMAAANHGQIELISADPSGSCFRLTLPLAKTNVNEP